MDKVETDTSSSSSSSSDGDLSIPMPGAAVPVSTPPVATHNSISRPPRPQEADNDNDDSASDISMAAETDEEDQGSPRSAERKSPKARGTPDTQAVSSKKRKSSDQENDQIPAWTSTSIMSSKKAKLEVDREEHINANAPGRDKSLLPPEIWHHIFTFCPPQTLGNLLRVNKLFHVYLDPSSSLQSASPLSPGKSAISILKPNSIWQASRRLFWPHMPAPLRSMTELESWRLARSIRCQSCNKQDARGQQQPPPDPWHPGPGMDGVSVIWPFAIRVCGLCLLRMSFKEIDLLLSPSVPSAVIPALPFVVLTPELHALSASTYEQGQLPTTIQVTKLFLASDVEELKKEFLSVQEMGPGTTEEWFKGLDGRGKDHRSESVKWEKWEASGGRISILAPVNPSPSQAGPPATSALPAARMPGDLRPAPAQFPGAAPRQDFEENNSGHQSRPLPPGRQERTIEEVAKLKATRKSEIERRASLLDPPLQPNILRRIPSFQAATQLITPLDDNAWELLKPRLLAQRADAEQREAESVAQAQILQRNDKQHNVETTLATTKEARDMIDKDWEEVQAPVRASIASLADEVIRDGWDNGKKVTKETCSKFAADVLTHVRRRFYAEVTEAAAATRAAGQEPRTDPPEGPFTQKLTLENMKWIFDSKIKPHTESQKKEIFFCNGCEGNFKAYGFEGVIQHYAAKHTSALSLGSVVVHWRAEWPEVPPFAPQARGSKHLYYAPGPISFTQSAGPPTLYGFNGYQPAQGPAPPPPGQPFPPSGSVYGAPPYNEQYPPQSSYQHGVSYPPSSGFTPQPFQPQPVPAQYPSYQPPSAPNGTYPSHPAPVHTPGYPPQVSAPPPNQGLPPPPTVYNYNSGGFHGDGQVAYPPPPNTGYPDTYQVRLEDVVRNSREIWIATANIRDLPGSARVFVTIHHVVKRFRSRFLEAPPLEMFNDGLSNNKDMRPVRNINVLSCKACHFGLGNAASVEQDRKTFSLPQLVNHFQNKHVDPMQRIAPGQPPLDWTVDMILLPDPAVLARLPAIIGSDSQRHYLFSDAFPEYFQQPSSTATTTPYYYPLPPYQPGPDYPSVYPPAPVDSHDRTYAQHQSANAQTYYGAEQDGYQTPAASATYEQPSYSQGPPQNGYVSAPSQEPGYHVESMPQNPVPTRSGDNKSRSSQSSGPGRGNQRSKKSAKSKRGRGKHSDAAGAAASLVTEAEAKKAEDEERVREEEIRAMWAADRAEAARVYSSSAKPETETDQGPQGQPELREEPNPAMARPPKAKSPPAAPTAPVPQISQRSSPPRREEPNLMAALEMHLEQGHSRPASEQRPQPPSRVIYVDDDHPPPTRVTHRDPDRYPVHHPSDRIQSISPAFRYRQPPTGAEVYRERSPVPRQAGRGYYPHPPPAGGMADARYEQIPRPGADRYEQIVRRPDDALPYDRIHRTEEVIYDRQPPARQEYYRPYPDEPLPRSRAPPVEAYEIVQVIDSQGEYYIRRPVRREPEPRYIYEDERHVRREPELYHHPTFEPVYSRAPPPPPPSYDSRAEYPLPRMAGPPEPTAYDEEYDPRFPAAPPPGGVPPRQVRYQ